MSVARLTDPYRQRPSFKTLRLREVSLVVAAALAGFAVSRFMDKPEVYKESRLLMGTLVEIQIPDRGVGTIAAVDSAFQIMGQIDALFRPMGAAAEFASEAFDHSLSEKVPEQEKEKGGALYEVLEYGFSMEDRFPHSFHLGMQELMSLWDFDSALEPPDSLLLSDVLMRVSKRDDRAVQEWGFGALAKGYAVDQGLATLKALGMPGALINAGGDLASYGPSFLVGIQHPRLRGGLLTRLNSINQAVATSGDYERCFFHEGFRYHHVLEPSSGQPARDCQSVTVAAPSCMEADAWATALFVMGPQTALALASRTASVEVLIVDAEGQEWKTAGFALLEEDAQ
jgi:FAD:protein FMN transferase